MKYGRFLGLLALALGYVAGCGDNPTNSATERTNMKFTVQDPSGNTEDIILLGALSNDPTLREAQTRINEELATRGLPLANPSQWISSAGSAQSDTHFFAIENKNTDPCAAVACGDHANADPRGDSCKNKNRSCYCFPCPIIVQP